MRRMTYPLTEKQKEIVDYSDGHGLEEDEARFGISHNQVIPEGEEEPETPKQFRRPWPSPGSNAG